MGGRKVLEDPFEGQYSNDRDDCVDKIEYKIQPTKEEQYCRRFISLCLFTIVLVSQGLATYFIQMNLRSLQQQGLDIYYKFFFVTFCYFLFCFALFSK